MVALFGIAAPPESDGAPRCHQYASTGGTDAAHGTLERPFRSVQLLVDALEPGQTGCLVPGVFHGEVTIRNGGRGEGARITLRSVPGGRRATLLGRLVIADSANYVTITQLVLDGSASAMPSPTVNGDYTVFERNEVTNRNTGICFVLGHEVWGAAQGTVISRNRIHHCGKLPRTNQDHGIYVAVARGVRIVDNVIYANADRGIQLYPDSQGTLIEHNVIDGNGTGVQFGGDEGLASSGNIVRENILSNATARYDVAQHWPGSVGTGNRVERNCVWGGRLGEFELDAPGFQKRANLVEDPTYRDRWRGDFRVRGGSPCAGKGPRPAT